MKDSLGEKIFNIKNQEEFESLALEVFNIQASSNQVYGKFIRMLGINPSSVNDTGVIPFLPIDLFKSQKIITGREKEMMVFESSGTTGSYTSRHYVTDLTIYEESFTRGFMHFYGDPGDYFIAALLPSYIERGNSSLIYMADALMKLSRDTGSGFYKDSQDRLLSTLEKVSGEKKKAMLIGVSYALMDIAGKYSPDLSGITVVETGGMKGRRKEMIREEMHEFLKTRFNVDIINSEYGMTELLSQAWSAGEGIFYSPPWMKILLREINDPLSIISDPGITGGINIIDLANINSCSFIATSDLGRLHADGGFEVLGRFDNSDIRGCNLLIE